MRWEAANVKENARPEGGGGLKKSLETVEAAISRLTRAYTAAIKCIGSLHRLESIQEKDEASIQSMQRVADAARSTFERTILSDPLIAESLAPTWHGVVKRRRWENEWSFIQEARPIPPELTSSSHQSAVRELAYLSLVNYADLLVKACSTQVQGEGILQRGVVSRVPQLSWSEQEEEFMQRLAVAALCDASDLDGSDPTVWLKLACAARRLSVIAEESHDRLERHALEQGVTALPSDVPPNRLIVKALEQHYKERETITEYPEKLCTPEETPSLVLDLPRYSWSMLGRMLLRACREGSAYRPHFFSAEETTQVPFGSPCIVLKLSPMLTLPLEALGTICQYLDNRSIWKFEATCKALSASILSARLSMERRGETSDVVQNEMDESPLESAADQSKACETGPTASNDPSAGPATTATGVMPDVASNRQTSASTNDSEASRSHRTSKRVQSQRITSGKLAERKAKRNSVELCFLATVFGCTSNDEKYKAALREKIDWDDSIPADLRIRPLPSRDVASPSKTWSKQQRDTARSQARMGSASLTAFVEKWSGRNAGPLDILSRYLAHVAMNVEDVFTVDSDNAVALAPFVIESIDALSHRGGSQLVGLEPSWHGAREFSAHGSVRDAIEVFSINLLNAELRLRSCERIAFCYCDYNNDGTVVAALVPDLLGKASEIEMAFPSLAEDRVWLSLKARLNWLAAGFYFWWNRVSQNIRESREAQSLGLEYVDEAIQTLKLPLGNPIRSVRTPQLVSQARSGEYWATLSEDSLATFRDELQASSVVSIVREQFVEEVGNMEQRRALSDGNEDISVELTENEKRRLAENGTDLICRYDIPDEGTNRRLTELVDDFLEISGSDLYFECDEGPWSKIWDSVPSELPVVNRLLLSSNPSILSVLGVCMLAKESNKLSLLTLLSHLVLAGYKHIGTQLQKMSGANQAEKILPDGDDDDFSDSEDSLASGRDAAKNVECKDDEILLQRYIRLVQFLLAKIQDIYEKNKVELSSFPASKECLALVHYSLAFAADWYRDCQDKAGVLDSPLDLHVFLSTLKLVRCLLDFQGEASLKRPLQSIFFTGLSRILSGQRETFPGSLRASADKKIGRAIRQKICLSRAEYIGLVASEMAYMLSIEQSTIDSGKLIASHLVRDLYIEGREKSCLSMSRLASLCESVLWFWKYMTVHEPDQICTVRLSGGAGTSSFDRPIIETLYAPVSGLVIGLCGSGIESRNVSRSNVTSTINTNLLCVSEFYDSDSSCTELVLGATEDDGTVSHEKSVQAQLLKGLCHAAHCIALVSVELNAKVATLYKPLTMCDDQDRPLLPLVTSRVSNHLADILLTEFGVEQIPVLKRKNLWVEEYPFGTRAVGGLIDFTLYKAYRALHGFMLTGTGAQQAIIDMDHLSPMSSDDITPSQTFKPESPVATAQLYRCMLRASGTVGRKSLPKEALECVLSALPAMEESERSRVIRDFLFAGDGDYFLPREMTILLKTDPDEVQPIRGIPGWVWNAEASPESESHSTQPKSQEMEDAMLVRRGICHELAQGPLPLLSAGDVARNAKKSSCNRDGIVEERVSSGTNEEELSKKFEAVIDDLCYGEPVNSKGWYDASICLIMKADLIADRLGLSKGFSRSDDFHIPTNRGNLESKTTLADLVDSQEQEYERNSQGWKPYLGKNLSVYIRQQWASFASLRETFDEIGGGSNGGQTDEDAYAAHVWQEIGSLYEKGDFVGWQQAFGGMFVAALRQMALRCLYVALHLLRRQDARQSSNGLLAAEIAESLGSLYYSQIMGSQMYGYPMHVLTNHHKRELTETARTCFQFAIDASGANALDEDEESRQTWDLLFMRGKCNEKIAATYKKEAFRGREDDVSSENEPTRAYERHMKQALQDFAASYEEAKAIDNDGGLGEIHGGGSTHGLTEVFYRLHASRFKCLLWAVRQREADRDMAEAEAVRLTSTHWFQKPTSDLESLDIRERVWAVLVDCVVAFAQCRIDQPFFHRSVYRHAQALMWAPAFHDPALGMANGSLGTVPITKGHLLRGLNSTTPCAYSVEAIMNPLFEKRRPQICAVWVTNTNIGQSPFELLNAPIRKYDSLRGKYISAYIDTLRLCNRRSKLETLLQTLGSAPRDLPSLFQSSAMAQGGPPEFQHTKESLLIKGRSLMSSGFLRNLKREANSALASITLHDLSSEDTKGQQDALKAAYACFLRLNCTIDELRRTRAWKFGQSSLPEVDALCQAYLARGEDNKKVQTESSNWIGGGQKNAVLKAAIEKCQELFPQMSKELYGKRKARSTGRSKAKAADSAPTTPAEAPPVSGQKRKDPEQSQTFAVSVPEGLSAGDKFDTTVQLGDGSNKKLRLTVPPGNPTKLQFTLAAPSASED